MSGVRAGAGEGGEVKPLNLFDGTGKEEGEIVFERSNSESTSAEEELCQRDNGKIPSYKREPRVSHTEIKGVPLWNEWNVQKGKTMY